MNPDPRERLPREIFEELMEEGAEAFRNVLEKLLNLAMELERSEFLGSGTIREDEPAARSRQRLQGQDRGHAGGTPEAQDPQVRHLSFYPKSLERGCRSEKALKLAIAEMYVKGVSTRKVSQITEQLCGPRSRPARSRGLPSCWTRSWSSSGNGSWGIPGGLLGCPLREGAGQWHGAGPGHPESDWSELLGETRSPGGLGGA